MVWTAHLTPLSLFGSPPFIFISYFAIPLACFASHNLLRCASGCTNTGYDPPKRTPNSLASSSPLGWLTVCPRTSDLIYHASMHPSSIRHASVPLNTFYSKDLSREYFFVYYNTTSPSFPVLLSYSSFQATFLKQTNVNITPFIPPSSLPAHYASFLFDFRWIVFIFLSLLVFSMEQLKFSTRYANNTPYCNYLSDFRLLEYHDSAFTINYKSLLPLVINLEIREQCLVEIYAVSSLRKARTSNELSGGYSSSEASLL